MDFDLDLLDFDRDRSGRGRSPLPEGTRVQVVRARPLAPGSIVKVAVGDIATILRASATAYAIDIGGAVAVVFHADVVKVEP